MSDLLGSIRSQMQSGLRRSMQQLGVAENSNSTLPLSQQIYLTLRQRLGERLKYLLLATVMTLMLIHIVITERNELSFAEQQHAYLLKQQAAHNASLAAATILPNMSNMTQSNSTSIPIVHGPGNSLTAVWLSLFLSMCCWFAVIQCLRYLRNGNLGLTTLSRARFDTSERMILSQLMQMSRSAGSPAMAARLRMLMLNRDFTGDDYEMLQQLDSGGAGRGASEQVINQLPVLTVSEEDARPLPLSPSQTHLYNAHTHDNDLQMQEEGRIGRCNICLAPYEAGERLRALPCMHRFHQACLDPWLRTNAVCPVCKLAIR